MSCRFTYLRRSASMRMTEPDHADGAPSEEERALLAEAERRFEALLDMLPPELREEIDEGKISRHEASTFVLDCLLIDAAVWQDAQKLLAPRKPKAKRGKKADNTRKLAAAFNAYAETAPHPGKSIGSLVRNFRKTLGSEFSWLRGMSHERVEALIREGRRLLVPDMERLINARRASVASGSRPAARDHETNEPQELPNDDEPRRAVRMEGPVAEPRALSLNAKEKSFLRLIKRQK